MKTRGLVLMAGILLVTLACGLGAPAPTPADTQPGVETIVAETMQALTSVAPLPTETESAQPSGLPVTFQNISFVIPEGLASGATTEVVPAMGVDDGAPWEVAPAYSKISLTGYALQNKFFEPYVVVYPAAEFASVNEGAAYNIETLRSIIANPSTTPTKDDLPGITGFNAGMVFASNIQVLRSQNGAGVRTLTEYAQYYAPINNHEMIYQYQGLTDDGKYYVVAILPVNAPFLASSADPAASVPAGGIPFPDYNTADETQFNAYHQAVTDKLNATSPESFTPTLSQLDALLQSITIASE